MDTHDLLLALSNKYKGDWEKIYKAILAKECGDDLKPYLTMSTSSVISLLDREYPEQVKQSYHPPFVLYYKGDKTLLTTNQNQRLAMTVSRQCPITLFEHAHEIAKLPKSIIIVTKDGEIVDLCNKYKRKVIVVKLGGLDIADPHITTEQEQKVCQNGGLIISRYPDGVGPQKDFVYPRAFLLGSLCSAILIVAAVRQSPIAALIQPALDHGKPVMVFPTNPECGDLINNSLIADGAYLVENAQDILDTMKI